MSLTFVQGDDAPSIVATIHDEDDPTQITDLSLATSVRFQMRKDGDRKFTVNGVATVTDAAEGAVRYDWGPNDLSVSGTYLIQWEVTWTGGKIQTTSPEVEITVRKR